MLIENFVLDIPFVNNYEETLEQKRILRLCLNRPTK